MSTQPTSRTSFEPRSATGAVVSGLVAVAVTLLVWMTFVQFDWSVSKAIGLFNVFFCTYQVVRSIFTPSAGPIALTFWPFVLIWIAFASVVQLGVGRMYWPDGGLEYLFPWAQTLFAGAIVAYSLGTGFGRRRASSSPVLDTGPSAPRPPRVWTTILLGILLLPLVLSATGGIAGRFATRLDTQLQLAESGLDGNSLTLFFVNRLPQAVAIVAGYAAARQFVDGRGDRVSGRRFRGIALLAALVLMVFLVNPFSNPRFVALSAIVGLLFGFVRVGSTGRRALIAVGTALGMLFVYPLSTFFKRSSSADLEAIGTDTFTGIDFDGYQTTINALSYVEMRGISFGEHILAAFGFFIPRAIWESKPVPASIDVSAARGYLFQNLSLPVWAEFYVDLGLVGMLVAMFLLGWFSAHLDHAYALDGASLRGHLAVLFSVGQFAVIRGPLGSSVVFSGTVLLLGLLAFRRVRAVRGGPAERRPRPAARAATRV